MSAEQDKAKKNRRIERDQNAIQKQLRIGQSHSSSSSKYLKQPNRLVKHRIMDCGRPRCQLCGNARKLKLKEKDKLTMQERRFLQDNGE